MKNKFIKYLVVLTAGTFLLLGNSCKKLEEFGDTNVNPNGSPDVLTSALLTNVLSGIGGTVADLNTGHYSQIFAEPTYPGNSLYVLPQFDASGIYSGALNDLQVIINRNSDPATAASVSVDGANANQIAISRILKAYYFWTITDRWGDVPYSEALKGVSFATPKYDEQQAIYLDLLKELKEANAQFLDNATAIRGDIVYGGNIAKWKKLSNTLRMLISLRMSKRDGDPGIDAAGEFADAAANGFIDDNADNFTISFPGGNFRNSFNNFSLSADNRTSQTIVDLITGLADTRVNAFFSNTSGVPYGLSTAAPTSITYGKILSETWHAEAAPLVIVNAASGLLAKAEAIALGWMTGDAKATYENGVMQSFQQWGQTMPANYLSTGAANFTTGTGVASIGGATVAGSNALTPDALSRIRLQQFIAFYPSGIQTWSNWRRTGVPDLKPTVNATAGDGIIRRYVYGQSDQNLNSAQLAIAVARIPGGVDDQDARVWWDR